MSKILLSIKIDAPIERVFDCARSIDVHVVTQDKHGERPVAGTTSGLIGLGQDVTWEAKHLGVRQHLTVKITAFKRPYHFQSAMTKGAFNFFKHDHFFESQGESTLMKDELEFASPFGPLGKLVDQFLLNQYLKNLLRERSEVIKRVAETDEWKKYLP